MPRTFSHLLRWAALALILIAASLTAYAWSAYRRQPAVFPPGTTIAGTPVGGLDRAGAESAVRAAYDLPVEMSYQDALIQARPEDLGFSLDVPAMLDQAQSAPYPNFWAYLWKQASAPTLVPLRSHVDESQLRAFLEEQVAARYDHPAQPAAPHATDPYFTGGEEGTALDIDQAVSDLSQALTSRTDRQVTLSVAATTPSPLPISGLQALLEGIIRGSDYPGLAEVYVQDLANQQTIHFALNAGEEIPPDVSYSAASIIKIPIMVSVYRHIDEPAPDGILKLLERMIEESDNSASDQVAQQALDVNTAPMLVSADMRALGLQNTFWAGFFYLGAPLLDLVQTPANQRTDIDTQPDIYSQTTPGDVGWLLGQIYACAKDGSGALTSTWPGEITTGECQQMLDLLKGNHLGQLVQAGLPDGIPYAHKHGWAVDAGDGLLHNLADAGIAFTPGGDYTLVIFFHQDSQLNFEDSNLIFARLALASYEYFQQPH